MLSKNQKNSLLEHTYVHVVSSIHGWNLVRVHVHLIVGIFRTNVTTGYVGISFKIMSMSISNVMKEDSKSRNTTGTQVHLWQYYSMV